MLLIANIFQPLIDVFEAVIKFYNGIGVPWGWSIVLLTITVRALMVPLTVKQIGSMARMQALQPQMKEIQKKYKDDKQRQQQEMMKFYKENNVNPLGSCLPMVAQLPVFISLYYMLRQQLRVDICPDFQRFHNHGVLSTAHTVACGSHGQSNFLFIGDITSQATGVTLIILIILYVGSQLGSTLMMQSATMDKTQRQIMLFMPLIFVLFVIRFPAGVLVYWITTNLWTVTQQYVVKRRIGPIQAVAPSGDAAVIESDTPGRPRPGSARPSRRADTAPSAPAVNGGQSGGLGGLIRRARGEAESSDTGNGNGAAGAKGNAVPPRSPRKKKKRSGRRR